jgi:hypothetical protein
MAEKSGFFNARLVDGEYDRKYSANDYSDNLAVVIGTGVLRSNIDDLKVTSRGMLVTVAAGRAWINGHYYHNNSAMTLAAVPAASGGNRYDRVVLRMDKQLNARNVSVVYLQGTASNDPQKPALTRNDNVYDICLADVYVASGSSNVVVYDTRQDRDVCGWVYSTSGDDSFFTSLDNDFWEWFDQVKDTLSSATILKRYTFERTLSSATNQVSFTASQYDPDTCFIEVFVNGMYETDYTVASNSLTITFTNTLKAGTEVVVNLYKNIDGTGINSVLDDIEELQNAVASMDGTSKFTYKLTGTNDNISLSQIAQAILNGSYTASQCTEAAAAFLDNLGSAFFENLNDDAQVTIYVEGQNLTATTPFEGAGTSASRYRWFSLGQMTSTERKVTFDFANCQNISIVPSANTGNIIFYGDDLHIKNARVSVFTTAASCAIDMISSSHQTGTISVEDCEFSVLTTGKVTLGENGTFINCRATLRSSANHALAFVPKSASLIRIIGGTFFTYIKASGMTAAIIYVYANEVDAVVLAQNISCPTVALSGYSQQYLSTAFAGKVYISGVISTQTTQGNYNEVVGQIWKSKN